MWGVVYFFCFDKDKIFIKVEVLSEYNVFEMLLKNRVDLVIVVEEIVDYLVVIL